MTWLLVEDDNDIRNVVSVMMSVWGEKPLAFADGSAAWKWLDSVTDGTFKGELPELALMDIRMPGYTGDKVAARIRQTSALKDIPIILMTAFALSEVEARVMMEQAGVDHLIYKPLPDMDVFKTTLYEVRDQRRTLVANAKPSASATAPQPATPAPPPAPAATPPVSAAPATPPAAPPPAAQSAPPEKPSTQPAPATPAKPAQPPAQPPAPTAPTQSASPSQPAKPAPATPPTPPAQSAQSAQSASPPAPPAAPPQPTKQATPQGTPQTTSQATTPKPAAPPTDNKRQDKPGNDRK